MITPSEKSPSVAPEKPTEGTKVESGEKSLTTAKVALQKINGIQYGIRSAGKGLGRFLAISGASVLVGGAAGKYAQGQFRQEFPTIAEIAAKNENNQSDVAKKPATPDQQSEPTSIADSLKKSITEWGSKKIEDATGMSEAIKKYQEIEKLYTKLIEKIDQTAFWLPAALAAYLMLKILYAIAEFKDKLNPVPKEVEENQELLANASNTNAEIIQALQVQIKNLERRINGQASQITKLNAEKNSPKDSSKEPPAT